MRKGRGKKQNGNRKRLRKSTPRVAVSTPSGGIRTAGNPKNYNKEKPAWALSKLDSDGPKGARQITAKVWWTELHPKLKDFESMTWAEILAASGGRTSGNNSHYISWGDLTKEARDRLSYLGQDDIDQVFSLRLAGTKRIIGIRDGNILHIIWYDSNHWVAEQSR